MDIKSNTVPNVDALQYKGTPEKPDIKIFVSHRIDLDSQTVDNPLYIPVRCGAIYDKREGITMLGDDTGDNISSKRQNLGEVTVLYWMWKNIKADYYGLCHYRRYFLFSDIKYKENIYGEVDIDYLSDYNIKKYNMDDDTTIHKLVDGYDLIISAPADLKRVGLHSLYEQYSTVLGLHVQDLKLAIQILKEKYPQFSDAADQYMNGKLLYPCNLGIMKYDVFHNYCEWLFNILDELESRIDLSQYSLEGHRSLGHIAERLFGIYYTYISKNCPHIKTKILQRTIIRNTEKLILPKPAYTEKNVPVVFACSDYFVPYVAVTLISLLENSNRFYNYDIIFLHSDISNINQTRLREIFTGYSNFSLRFFNIGAVIANRNFQCEGHISPETFYRLSVRELLANYSKVLYLDSDIIIQKDVAELYLIDIGNNLVAATIDADRAGEYSGAIPGVRDYEKKVMQMENPYQYFQAGVIVFNIAEMQKAFCENELLDFAETRKFMYVDQDVLNIKCEGRVHILEANWNVMTDCDKFRVNGIIKHAPKYIYDSYMKSRENPYIIHYAGQEKPWNSPLCDYSEQFWRYARNSIFYESILYRMSDFISQFRAHEQRYSFLHSPSGIRIFADKIFPKGSRRRQVIKRLLPKGSLRWRFCKQIYYIFKPQYRPAK